MLANIVSLYISSIYLGYGANGLQMADKENMWISKQEWEEQGARALEKLGAR